MLRNAKRIRNNILGCVIAKEHANYIIANMCFAFIRICIHTLESKH